MKRSSWALDAYYHTHVETWLGSGWGGQLLDMWRGKVAIGGGWAGGQGEKVTWRVKGPKLKRGHRRLRIMQPYLTLALPFMM